MILIKIHSLVRSLVALDRSYLLYVRIWASFLYFIEIRYFCFKCEHFSDRRLQTVYGNDSMEKGDVEN